MKVGYTDTELKGGEMLPVAESFYTIQGEGCNTGKAAFFLRLGGCDVYCPWCDSKSTWDARLYPLSSVSSIIGEIMRTPAKNAVITGGEPLLYPLGPLCGALKEHGYNIFLETSGTHPPSGRFDWICLSPKRHCPPLKEPLAMADELKIIVSGPEDLVWAEELKESVKSACVPLLQPEWDRRESIVPLIVSYVKEHPEWRISLQTHKYIYIP